MNDNLIWQPYVILCMCLKGQCEKIFVSGFFHESSFLKTLKKTLGSFQRFSKIHGDIHNSRRITGIIYTSCKFTTSTVGVVDTGGGFGTSVNVTGGKFVTSDNNTGGK